MKPFKEVGVHQIEYSITWDGTAKKRNYEVSLEDLGDLTIYYELSFDANGGKDTPKLMEVVNDSAEIPTDVPKKDGYEFLGWATSRDATEAKYQPGETIELKDNTKLYAVWKKDVSPGPEPKPEPGPKPEPKPEPEPVSPDSVSPDSASSESTSLKTATRPVLPMTGIG